jgi:hypothetical protein
LTAGGKETDGRVVGTHGDNPGLTRVFVTHVTKEMGSKNSMKIILRNATD